MRSLLVRSSSCSSSSRSSACRPAPWPPLVVAAARPAHQSGHLAYPARRLIIDSLREDPLYGQQLPPVSDSINENACQLCKQEKLTFEPPPMYCFPCGARIRRNGPYYAYNTGDTSHSVCIPCYNKSRGHTIEVEGQMFPKARFQKNRNDEETEECWVNCERCSIRYVLCLMA